MKKSKATVKKSEVRVNKPGPRYAKPMVTEHNLRILKEMLSGKYISAGITREKGEQLGQVLNASGLTVSAVLRKLENMGIVVGYIPLLSEEGRRIVDALELMYGLKKGNHDALVDIMGEENP